MKCKKGDAGSTHFPGEKRRSSTASRHSRADPQPNPKSDEIRSIVDCLCSTHHPAYPTIYFTSSSCLSNLTAASRQVLAQAAEAIAASHPFLAQLLLKNFIFPSPASYQLDDVAYKLNFLSFPLPLFRSSILPPSLCIRRPSLKIRFPSSLCFPNRCAPLLGWELQHLWPKLSPSNCVADLACKFSRRNTVLLKFNFKCKNSI